MRHRFLFPNPAEVPSSPLSTVQANTLHLRIRTRRQTRSGMQQTQTTLLRGDSQKVTHRLQHGRDDRREERIAVHIPDATVHVARVHAVDGDVLVLWVQEESALQFREPDLEVELVVLVELDAFTDEGALASVEIAQVEFAQVVEAGCCTDDAGRWRFCERGEEAQRDQDVREEVDLVDDFETVFGLEDVVAAGGGADSCVVAEDVQCSACV